MRRLTRKPSALAGLPMNSGASACHRRQGDVPADPEDSRQRTRETPPLQVDASATANSQHAQESVIIYSTKSAHDTGEKVAAGDVPKPIGFDWVT